MTPAVFIRTLHKVVAVSALLMASQTSADPFRFDTDKAYMLVRATAANEAVRQPNWIALLNGTELLHVKTRELIIELAPGTYEISHFDFGKGKMSGFGTRDVNQANRMDLIAGEVYLAGEFILTGTLRRNHKVESGDTISLITAACKMAPEFFKHFPLRIYNQEKSVMVPCDNLLNKEAEGQR